MGVVEKKRGRNGCDFCVGGPRGPSRKNRYTVRETARFAAMIPRFSSALFRVSVSWMISRNSLSYETYQPQSKMPIRLPGKHC